MQRNIRMTLGAEEVRDMGMRRLSWAEKLEEAAWNKGVERGWQKGVEIGLEQGIRHTILLQLGVLFGQLSEDVKQRVDAISSVERLKQMAEQLLFVRSLEEMGLKPGHHSKDCQSTSAPAAGESV
jgi:hypothetical protein